MRVRAQDANGDYTFGRGSGNFLIDSPACVAQLLLTNLLLKEGEWFLDITVGTPWSQSILGYTTQPVYDQAIRTAILNSPGVTSIESYSSSLNPQTRKLTVTGFGDSEFGTVPINAVL